MPRLLWSRRRARIAGRRTRGTLRAIRRPKGRRSRTSSCPWRRSGMTSCTRARTRASSAMKGAWMRGSRATGSEKGDVFDLATLWNLASGWYAGRLDRDYRRREPAEAAAYFRGAGLSRVLLGVVTARTTDRPGRRGSRSQGVAVMSQGDAFAHPHRRLRHGSPFQFRVPPVGAAHFGDAVVHSHHPPAGVERAVVEPAEQHSVVGVGRSAARMLFDVVDLAP